MVIALWHGYYDAIIIWVLLNIMLSYSEVIGTIIVGSFVNLKTSPQLKALFGSPYLALAYLSNIFFLSNYETGMLFIQKIFRSFTSISALLFVLYCGCNVCQQINTKIN